MSTKDLRSLAQKLRDFLDTPEGKESMRKFGEKMRIEDERKQKTWEYLETLSDEEYQSKIKKLIEWEYRFEEREYQKGKLKASNLFNIVFDAIARNATEYENDDMFFGGGATYRGQQWIVYVGQGSFYTIEENGERIFQSN